jgi:hypothetical protein
LLLASVDGGKSWKRDVEADNIPSNFYKARTRTQHARTQHARSARAVRVLPEALGCGPAGHAGRPGVASALCGACLPLAVGCVRAPIRLAAIVSCSDADRRGGLSTCRDRRPAPWLAPTY